MPGTEAPGLGGPIGINQQGGRLTDFDDDEEFPETADELIDQLPIHLRNKVIGVLGIEPHKEIDDIPPMTAAGVYRAVMQLVFAFVAIPVGVAMTLTILLAPFGIPLTIFGGLASASAVRYFLGGR